MTDTTRTALKRRLHCTGSDAHTTLAEDLATFRTQADLAELAAVLDRYEDDTARPIRELVDWTRAA